MYTAPRPAVWTPPRRLTNCKLPLGIKKMSCARGRLLEYGYEHVGGGYTLQRGELAGGSRMER